MLALCCGAVCLALGLVPSSASAEPDDGAAIGGGEVRMFIAADAGEAEALALVARELLGRLGVSLTVSRVDRIERSEIARARPAGRTVAEVWIDLTDERDARIFILDGARDRLLVRELPRARDTAEITREAIGHIIETSTEGLLTGSSIGVPRAEALGLLTPPPPPRAPAPPPSSARPAAHPAGVPWLQAGLHYEAQSLAAQLLVAHGPAASLVLRAPRSVAHPGVWLSAQYRQPVHTGSGPVGVRLEGAGLRLLGSLTFELGRAAALRAGAGPGVDVFVARPEALSAEPLELAPPRQVHLLVARAAADVELRIGPFTTVSAGLVLDTDPSDTRFVYARRSGDEGVLRLAPLRPGLEFGVEVP